MRANLAGGDERNQDLMPWSAASETRQEPCAESLKPGAIAMTLSRRSVMLSLTSLGGCSVLPRQPDVAMLYKYLPDADRAKRRPLITVPGLLGSRLRMGANGPFLWGGPDRLSADPDEPHAARALALPFANGKTPLGELPTPLRADGVLRRANARFLGATVEEIVYDGLLSSLNSGGYEFSRTAPDASNRPGGNPGSLEFAYDWRRDIVETAQALDAFVRTKAIEVARVRHDRYGMVLNPETMRFDFVAHSMGGLVLRYWLMYGAQDLPDDGGLPELTWAGSTRTACAIFVAPPNLGSANAFAALLNGRDFGLLQPRYHPALIGTHPSAYQLMPRARHNRVIVAPGGATGVNIYDPALWASHGWGVLDPRERDRLAILMPDIDDSGTRRAQATQHLARMLSRAEQFHRAIDLAATAPYTDMFLVAGTGLDTLATSRFDEVDRRLVQLSMEEGDGVVLRASALSDEGQGGHIRTGPNRPIGYRTVLLLPGEHVALTNSPVFSDNLLYWLLDAPRARAAPLATRNDGASAGD